MARYPAGSGSYVHPPAIAGRRENIVRGNRGAWAEALAVVWLIENGYDVFTNVSAHGPIDMVAMRDGITILIDVKTVTVVPTKSGECIARTKLTELQKQLGVRHLLVRPEGEVYWDDVFPV